jgi:hypothetical protein
MLRTHRSLEAYCATRDEYDSFRFSLYWSMGGMKLTGENLSQSTTNPTWTDLRLKPGLCGDGRVTNRLSHGTALK